MKLILTDFNYKGHGFKHFEIEWPNIKNLEDVPVEKAVEYVCESLDQFVEEES